jgi:hypothetical protein
MLNKVPLALVPGFVGARFAETTTGPVFAQRRELVAYSGLLGLVIKTIG